jgi:hypothetical protein
MQQGKSTHVDQRTATGDINIVPLFLFGSIRRTVHCFYFYFFYTLYFTLLLFFSIIIVFIVIVVIIICTACAHVVGLFCYQSVFTSDVSCLLCHLAHAKAKCQRFPHKLDLGWKWKMAGACFIFLISFLYKRERERELFAFPPPRWSLEDRTSLNNLIRGFDSCNIINSMYKIYLD